MLLWVWKTRLSRSIHGASFAATLGYASRNWSPGNVRSPGNVSTRQTQQVFVLRPTGKLQSWICNAEHFGGIVSAVCFSIRIVVRFSVFPSPILWLFLLFLWLFSLRPALTCLRVPHSLFPRLFMILERLVSTALLEENERTIGKFTLSLSFSPRSTF